MQAPFADPLSGLDGRDTVGSYTELPLIGRDTEMYVICALLDTVVLNRPTGARALTISGDIGVGKSRLLAEMFTEARKRGFRVLEGRTYELGCMFPYLPFIEALRPVLSSSLTEDLRRYMGLEGDKSDGSGARLSVEEPTSPTPAGDHKGPPHTTLPPSPLRTVEEISLIGTPLVAALARLFPDLPQMLQVTISHEVLSPDQEKFRLFDAVATLLGTYGDGAARAVGYR